MYASQDSHKNGCENTDVHQIQFHCNVLCNIQAQHIVCVLPKSLLSNGYHIQNLNIQYFALQDEET